MGQLLRVFSSRPKTRLLEALLELGPVEFTRGQLAAQAGIPRTSTLRMFPQLLEEGLVRQVTTRHPPRFRVVDGNPMLRILGYLEAAVSAQDRHSGDAVSQDAVEALADRLNEASLPGDFSFGMSVIRKSEDAATKAAKEKRR